MRMSGSSNWFKALFGAEEPKIYKQLHDSFRLSQSHDKLTSHWNNKVYKIGNFSTPTLDQIRSRALDLLSGDSAVLNSDVFASSKLYNHIVAGDAFPMHYENPNAVFQAASQFNCLEFSSSKTTPEFGVENYQYDHTQGPACALACAAGTVYRNYFAPVNPDRLNILGQTKQNQINNLDELEKLLDNNSNDFWYVENGYTFSRDKSNLERLNTLISTTYNTPSLRGQLLDRVKIGLHSDVGVTFRSRYVPLEEGEDVTVTQVYASALSCAYSGIGTTYWEPLAKIALDAAYEATLWAAVINSVSNRDKRWVKSSPQDGHLGVDTVFNVDVSDAAASVAPPTPTNKNHKDVFLTFLGGGVFGNDNAWIAAAIGRAIAIVTHAGADISVHICHFRRIDPVMARQIDQQVERCLGLLRAGEVV